MSAARRGHHAAKTLHGHFHDQPWADQALCSQADRPFRGRTLRGSTREAKGICNGNPDKNRPPCPVRDDCLRWALDTDQRFGIFGGHSERDRRKLKKAQPADQLAPTGTDTPTPVAEHQDERPAPRTYGLPYVGGTNGHVPLPKATDVGIRPVHPPATPRPTGLDWSKHTAPEPEKVDKSKYRCRWCREVTDRADLVDDVCPDCRADAEAAFTPPTRLPEPPTEGKQGKPTTGTSAPGATSTSSTTGRAPVAGPSTTQEKDPAAAQEMRPAAAAGPSLVVEYVAQLLTDSATSTDPIVQGLRGSALSVLAALDLVLHPAEPAPEQPVAAPSSTRETATGPTTPPQRRRVMGTRPRARRSSFNLTEAQRLYLEEEKTCAEIATTLGSTVATVRKQLKAAGTPMRDDRARGSGGWNKKTADDDNPELVAAVRRHYLDEQLSIERTAAAVGLSPKGLAGLMNRHGIERRPPANVAGQAPRWQKLDDQAVATICERYRAGDSTVILAEAYGVSTPTITNALRRSGIELRTPAEARRLALTRNNTQEDQPA